MIDRRLVSSFDWWFFLVLVAILSTGVLSIYSVTYGQVGRQTPIYLKQIIWIGIGFVAFAATAFFDYHRLVRYSTLLYLGNLAALVLVLAIGRSAMGARRWLNLGPVDFQPSEWVKLVLILTLTHYFATRPRRQGVGIHELIVPGLLLVVPLVLVLKQPDLGTALTLVFVFGVIVFLVGLRSKAVGISTLVAVMAFPFLWEIFWHSLKSYQKNRLIAFINPALDPMGRGYHSLQSRIAIGSGGFFGKGLFGGTQSQLKFLPEGHTDFIFAVFAEEWGFVGVFVLMLLYLLLIGWGIDVAWKAKDATGMLIGCGVVALLVFYLTVNIGMTLGLVPVVGVPLPLMSYGGNSIVTTMAGIGLLLNIKMRRFMLFY